LDLFLNVVTVVLLELFEIYIKNSRVW